MFKQRKTIKERANAAEQLSDKVAIKMVMGINRMQNAFAKCMHKITRGISVRVWKVFIVVFVIGWSTLSLYFIVGAFSPQALKYQNTSIRFIIKPARSDSLVMLEEIYKQRNKKLKIN